MNQVRLMLFFVAALALLAPSADAARKKSAAPKTKEAICKILRTDYRDCANKNGRCGKDCEDDICRSRAPRLDCDVAPRCKVKCPSG